MPRARVNGIEIDYEDGGRGPAVLLSHGYSATGRMWAPQRPVLEPSYRLITWDMRGHGQTDSPADPAQYSEALTVEDMRGLLAHLGVERAVIGGLSLGGYMSLAFHRRHPEMVRALVICDSGPGYRNDEARARLEQARPRARGGPRGPRARRARPRRAARCRRPCGTTAPPRAWPMPRAACSPRRAPPSSTRCPRIRVPTLIIVGDRDTPFIAPVRVHGQEDPRRAPRGDQGRRPFARTSTSPRPSTACCSTSSARCLSGPAAEGRREARRDRTVRVENVVEWYGPTRPTWVLPDAAPEAVERHRDWLAPHFMDARGRFLMSIHSFVLRTPGLTVLVDTCVGNDKPRQNPGWHMLQTDFPRPPRRRGLPARVRRPRALHAPARGPRRLEHAPRRRPMGSDLPACPLSLREDGVGALVEADGDEYGPIIADSVRPIVEAGRADLVEGDHRISEELRLEPTPGHTPGHVSLSIRSQGREAVVTGDLMHHPVQCGEPEWRSNFDDDPGVARTTRRAFCARYADRDVTVLGTHFGAPTAGHIVTHGDAWRYRVCRGPPRPGSRRIARVEGPTSMSGRRDRSAPGCAGRGADLFSTRPPRRRRPGTPSDGGRSHDCPAHAG